MNDVFRINTHFFRNHVTQTGNHVGEQQRYDDDQDEKFYIAYSTAVRIEVSSPLEFDAAPQILVFFVEPRPVAKGTRFWTIEEHDSFTTELD